MPAPLPTVRQRIIDYLLVKLNTMVGTMDDTDDPQDMWASVSRGSVSSIEGIGLPAICLDESTEDTIDMTWPGIIKELNFIIEWKWVETYGVNRYEEFNWYLGRLQETLFNPADLSLGNLARDIQEMNSYPQIEGPNDNQPSGALTFKVQYDHYNGNPYKTINEGTS